MIRKNRIVRDLFLGIMFLLCQVSLSNASIIYADKSPGVQNIASMKNGEIIENTFKDPQSNAITTVRFVTDNNQLHQTIKRDDLSNKKSEEFSIHYEKTATNNLHVTLLEGKSPHSNQRWQKDISAEQVIVPANQDDLERATYALYNYVCQSNGVAHSAKQNNTNTDANLCNNIFLDDKPFAPTSSQVAFLDKSNNDHGIKSALSSDNKIAVQNGSYHYTDFFHGVGGDTIPYNSNTSSSVKVIPDTYQKPLLNNNVSANGIEKGDDILGDIKSQFNQLDVSKLDNLRIPLENKNILAKPDLSNYFHNQDMQNRVMPLNNKSFNKKAQSPSVDNSFALLDRRSNMSYKDSDFFYPERAIEREKKRVEKIEKCLASDDPKYDDLRLSHEQNRHVIKCLELTELGDSLYNQNHQDPLLPLIAERIKNYQLQYAYMKQAKKIKPDSVEDYENTMLSINSDATIIVQEKQKIKEWRASRQAEAEKKAQLQALDNESFERVTGIEHEQVLALNNPVEIHNPEQETFIEKLVEAEKNIQSQPQVLESPKRAAGGDCEHLLASNPVEIHNPGPETFIEKLVEAEKNTQSQPQVHESPKRVVGVKYEQVLPFKHVKAHNPNSKTFIEKLAEAKNNIRLHPQVHESPKRVVGVKYEQVLPFKHVKVHNPKSKTFIEKYPKNILENKKLKKSIYHVNGVKKHGFQQKKGVLKAQHSQSMNDGQLKVPQAQASGVFPERIQEDNNKIYSVAREDFETIKDEHHLSSQAVESREAEQETFPERLVEAKPKTFSEKHPIAYQAMQEAATSAAESVVKEVLNIGFSYLSHIFSSKNNTPIRLPQVQEPRSIPLGDFRAPLMPGRPDLHNIIPRDMHAHRIEMEHRQKAAEYNPERMCNYNPGLIRLVESRIIIEQDITPSLLLDTTMDLPAAKDQVATSSWCENERQAALEATLDHKELPQPLDNNTQPFIFTDELADVFKHPGKTSLDQQLHFELCSTRASMQLLAEKHNLFLPIKNMESLVNHLSALAKVQNDPKVAFCLADACHYLFAASQALDRMTEIVQKGVVLGVVNSAQHTIDLCHKMVSHPYDDVIKPLTLASMSLAKAVAIFPFKVIKDPEVVGARMQAMSLALEEFVTKEPEQAVAYVVEFLLPSPVPNLTSLRKVFGVKKACKIEKCLEETLAKTKKLAAPVCTPVQEFLKRTQALLKLQVKRGNAFFDKAIDKVKDTIRFEHQIAVATEAGIVNVCEKELVAHAKRAAKEELKHAPKAAVGGASAGTKIEGAAVTEATREVVLEKVATFEQARNKALELFGEHGGRTRPHYGSLGIFEGKITGRESLDRKMRWRLDYDPKKGPHVHIENFKHGKGLKNSNKVIPFDGNEKTVEALLKQLNK